MWTTNIRLLVAAVAILGAWVSVTGCGSDPCSVDSDCGAGILYGDVAYRANSDIEQAPPRGDRLGIAHVIGCRGGGASTPKLGEVEVFEVHGVSRAVAIFAESGPWQGTYVAEEVAKSDWPKILRNDDP